jgi:hypothetical protein
MSWAVVLENPKHLSAFYDDFKGLEQFDLHEATFHRDGPMLSVRGDLIRFPDRRSPRWHASVNRVHARISFWGLTTLEIAGCATMVNGTLCASREGASAILFEFVSDCVSIRGVCEFVRLESLNGYVDETG